MYTVWNAGEDNGGHLNFWMCDGLLAKAAAQSYAWFNAMHAHYSMVNNVLPDTHNCQQMDTVNLRFDQYTVCYNLFYKTNISDCMLVVSMNRTITLSYTELLMLNHQMADISVLIAALYYIYPHSLFLLSTVFFVIILHFHCYKVSNMIIQSCERVYGRWQYQVLKSKLLDRWE